jgi:beta-glucosidase
MKTTWFTWMFLTAVLAFAQTANAPDNAPYLNPDLTAEKRAADLVSRMTLEEKVLQMQNSAPAIPRLNIPAYDWWNEALHGVARAGEATVFPQAIALAATWDTELMGRIADTISTEARAKYNEALRTNDHSRYHGLTFWSPNINIFRDPRWGRGQETYGEDPYLTGRLAVAFIKGMQGNDPHYFKAIATAKHYAVHSGPESTRHQVDVKPSARDLEDTYLPAFRAAIVEGKADSVMCAYNSVDGQPACVNTDLLQKRLRGEWGFSGYVVSDCGAIGDIFRGHKFLPTAAEASAAAVKAGADLTCGTEYRALLDAVKAGQITEPEIDRSLERLFVARFKLGMFDPPERVPFSKIPYSVNDSAEHRKIALEAARKSIVLLKNANQILPLKASAKIAVIGPSADDPEALMGNYNGFSSKTVTPLEGVAWQFPGTRFALGATYTEKSHAPLPANALTPPAGDGYGVMAEYFDNAELKGQPKLRRVETRPYMPSGILDAVVAAAVPARGYSVRWSGALRAPFAGDYVLGARGGRGATVFLDDKEVVGDNATTGMGRVREAHIQLESGHAYKLRVEYRQSGPTGGAQIVWIPPAAPLLAEALETVKSADVTLAFVGLNPSLEGEEMQVNIPGFSGGDRTDLNLPEPQERLVQAAIATGKPVVVILTSGSALAATYEADHAAAVLEAWYGGEEIGTAIAETLTGANNPSGRLPVTFYRSVNQLPPFDDYSMKGRTYRYFKDDALFGFGFGLSYSAFQYSGLRSQRTAKGARILARVKNDSARDGDEVVQLYVGSNGEPDDAIRQLRGFQRVHLRAGEAREVEFTLGPEDVPKGKLKVSVGAGQPGGRVARVEGVL